MSVQASRGQDFYRQRVLDAVRRVDRQQFVPPQLRHQAHLDMPLHIGHGQTISQPTLVAWMTELAEPDQTDRALDVGTGSGYQAALLAELVQSVYGVEIIKPLAREAAARLSELGYQNVQVRHGDGYGGWPEEAPFDIIIVAAAPDHIPPALVDQLAPGGRMVLPVGTYDQQLLVLGKSSDGTVSQCDVAPVAFVPMTGAAQMRECD